VTKTELIQIADECELFDGIWNLPELKELKSDKFIKFATLVAAAEREACAKVVASFDAVPSKPTSYTIRKQVEAIRARGNNDV